MDSIRKLKTVIKARGLVFPDRFGNPYFQVPPIPPPPTPSGPTISPPPIIPYFTGVIPCGQPDANKESCAACDLTYFANSISSISDEVVSSRLKKAKDAIAEMCKLLGGCSTSPAGNLDPNKEGTACVCAVMMALITDFRNTVNLALVQPKWTSDSRQRLNNTLASHEKKAKKGMIECFRSENVSNNKNAKKEILSIINTYSS